MENRYQFRERLCAPEKPFRYVPRKKRDNELSLRPGVVFSGYSGAVLSHAGADFLRFLRLCFGAADSGAQPVDIRVEISDQLPDAVKGYKGRTVEIRQNEILIRAFDERGAAQAVYDLEDRLTAAAQPYLPVGMTKSMPLFTPRMVHSAYGFNDYPEGYLQRLAKEGIDAILLTLRGTNDPVGSAFDINVLIRLAAAYGIDTYAYWGGQVFHSPQADDAEAVYDAAFGALFRAHPLLKGIVLVGENIQFPSRDKHTTGRPYWETSDEENLPDFRPAPSHWPCEDYPVWLELVKKTIRKERPDADIVFWTYNWGWAPEEDRLRCVDADSALGFEPLMGYAATAHTSNGRSGRSGTCCRTSWKDTNRVCNTVNNIRRSGGREIIVFGSLTDEAFKSYIIFVSKLARRTNITAKQYHSTEGRI